MTTSSRNPRQRTTSEPHAHRRPSRYDIHAQTPGQLLPGLMQELGLAARAWEAALLEEWPALVGPQVARYARPGRLEHGTLHIFVTHSIWLSELRRNQPRLLLNLQNHFGAGVIKRLRLQIDPDLGRKSPT